MKNRAVCVFVCLALCLLGVSTALFAQSDVASVTGRVLDPNGAIIIEATVTAKNVDTGVATVVRTNPEGVYSFVSLSPGNYEFTVSKHGFKEIVKPGVTLHLADTISMNFNMVVGELTEKVTVVAGASMINQTDASVSTVVDQTYIKNMPLNGRSLQDLIMLTPGVLTQTPQNNGVTSGNGAMGEFSVNGQRPEENYYTVDGVSANTGVANSDATASGVSGSVAAATALGTTQALVSVDELQELRVESSTYAAEYGRNPGGQFAFATKSGTNQWHGTAYDYVRNNYFDANDWFNNYLGVKAPVLRQNDFGGTLGGPLGIPHVYSGNDKTFFFVNYEGLRSSQPQPAQTYYVPDSNLRANAPAPLNQALNGFALPNGPELMCNSMDTRFCTSSGNSGMARFVGAFSNPADLDSTSVRLDHVVKDKLRLFFRFNDTSSHSSGHVAFFTPSVLQTAGSVVRTYTGGVTTANSSKFGNDLRINYTSNESGLISADTSYGGNTPVDLGQLSGTGAGSRASINLILGGVFVSLFQGNQSGLQRQWNFVDTANLTVGRHQFKFGGDYRRLTPILTPFPTVLNYTFWNANQVLSNSTQNTSYITQALNYPLYTNFSTFAQDEWKATQRLSLSMGLRWEVNPPPGVTKGLLPYALQGSDQNTWTTAPQGTPLWRTTWHNFAPRLGAAYLLRSAPGRETVIRAGSGVFFDTGQQLGSGGFVFGPGFTANAGGAGLAFPYTPAEFAPPTISNGQPDPNACLDSGCLQLYGFDRNLQLPYTIHWNLSVEQAVGNGRTVSLSYVGSHAERLLLEDEFFPSNNPQAGQINIVRNAGTSDYNSGQLQFRQRLSRGLTALGSYTFSHCSDYGSQNYSVGYQRGDCDYDVRQSFAGAFSYDLPNVGHSGLVNAVLHNWGMDDYFIARTAFPVTLNGNTLLQTDGRLFNEGLDLVGGVPIYLYGANCATQLQNLGDLQSGQGCPGGRAINPQAFKNVSCTLCLGTAPRNFVRGFGAWQMNLAIRRDFPIYERLKLQFRAEAFNILNHPNFGTIDPNCFGNAGVAPCLNPTFGQATATLANSWNFGQVLSSLYQAGGPRSMQFAMKFVF